MSLSRFALLAFLVPLAGAVGCKLDNDEEDVTYRATLNYFLGTDDNGPANGINPVLALLSEDDLDAFEIQAGLTQSAGNGFMHVQVLDASGTTPQAGAVVEAINVSGSAAGAVRYAVGTTFSGTTSTTVSGELVIFNLPPGLYNIRCGSAASTTTRSGNAYVEVEADGVTQVNFRTAAAGGEATLSGVTQSFANVGPAVADQVTIGHVGIGSPFSSLVSDATTGAYTTGTAVRSSNLLLLKLTKTGFKTSYNYVQMPAGALVRNLSIISDANHVGTDFVAASSGIVLDPLKGSIRGKVTDGGTGVSGCTVTATHEDGTSTGIVVKYGNSTGVPDNALTETDSGYFYVYNATPGTILLKASKAGSGGTALVEVFADSVTFLDDAQLDVSAATGSDVTVSGSVSEFFFGNVPEADLAVRGMTLTTETGNSGQWTLTTLPHNANLVVRCSK